MDVKQLAHQHLDSKHVMQLSTTGEKGPWACNIHFYTDDDFNVYWVSSTDSHHSRHIAENNQAAAAVLVHENTAKENYVIGFSIAGTADILPDNLVDKIAQGYGAKHVKLPEELSRSIKGDGPMKFYRLKPSKIILIDSKNFPEDSHQDIAV